MHLGDGGGSQRPGVEFGEDRVGRGAEFLAEQVLHLRPRGRGDLMVELGEFVDELGGEQVAAGGQQLAELDEADPALLQRQPHRSGQRGAPGWGVGLVASAASQVAEQAVAGGRRSG